MNSILLEKDVSDYEQVRTHPLSAESVELQSLIADYLSDPMDKTIYLEKKHRREAGYWLALVITLLFFIACSSVDEFKGLSSDLWWRDVALHFLKVAPVIVGLWVALSRFNRSSFLAEHYAHIHLNLTLVPRLSSDLLPVDKSRIVANSLERFMDLPNKKDDLSRHKLIESVRSVVEKLVDKIPKNG